MSERDVRSEFSANEFLGESTESEPVIPTILDNPELALEGDTSAQDAEERESAEAFDQLQQLDEKIRSTQKAGGDTSQLQAIKKSLLDHLASKK